MLKTLFSDYNKSFNLIIDNKWLSGTIIFFVVSNLIVKVPQLILQKSFIIHNFGNPVFNVGIANFAEQSFLEKILWAIHASHLSAIVGSFTLPTILGISGLIVAFLVFYKKIKLVRGAAFCKKVSLYSALILVLSLLVGSLGYYLKNGTLLMLGIVIGAVCIDIFFVTVLSIIEALVLSLLGSIVSGNKFTLGSLSEHSAKFVKDLFLFNSILLFVSTNFANQLTIFPSTITAVLIPHFINTYTGVFNLISYFSWFAYYFHPIFIVVFVLAPFMISLSLHKKFTVLLKESLKILKNQWKYYSALVIWTLILIYALNVLSNLVNPSVLAIARPIFVEIVAEIINSATFAFILFAFYLTAFRNILRFKQNS